MSLIVPPLTSLSVLPSSRTSASSEPELVALPSLPTMMSTSGVAFALLRSERMPPKASLVLTHADHVNPAPDETLSEVPESEAM